MEKNCKKKTKDSEKKKKNPMDRISNRLRILEKSEIEIEDNPQNSKVYANLKQRLRKEPH